MSLLKPIAAEKHLTLVQLVILWTLQQPAIMIALVGARNNEQAVENARAMDGQLIDKEVAIISACLKHPELVAYCW
jgi:aryl-alcohol dehydrogenase-like predicted oxidoreductase